MADVATSHAMNRNRILAAIAIRITTIAEDADDARIPETSETTVHATTATAVAMVVTVMDEIVTTVTTMATPVAEAVQADPVVDQDADVAIRAVAVADAIKEYGARIDSAPGDSVMALRLAGLWQDGRQSGGLQSDDLRLGCCRFASNCHPTPPAFRSQAGLSFSSR